MKPAPFELRQPSSVSEAVADLGAAGEDAKVLAGGQSLVPLMNFRLARPAVVVDIGRLEAELGAIERSDSGLVVGALARQRAVERAGWPLVSDALAMVAHPAIRNRGTVVGSICHADPAAELCAVALALDAVLDVRSVRGPRTIAAGDLIVGPLMTTLEPDELVTAIHFAHQPGWRWRMLEVSRRAFDFAITGVVAGIAPDSQAGRVVVFGAGPRAFRVDGPIDELPSLATSRAEPTGDIHADAGYRRHLVGVLAARALSELSGRQVRRA